MSTQKPTNHNMLLKQNQQQINYGKAFYAGSYAGGLVGFFRFFYDLNHHNHKSIDTLQQTLAKQNKKVLDALEKYDDVKKDYKPHNQYYFDGMSEERKTDMTGVKEILNSGEVLVIKNFNHIENLCTNVAQNSLIGGLCAFHNSYFMKGKGLCEEQEYKSAFMLGGTLGVTFNCLLQYLKFQSMNFSEQLTITFSDFCLDFLKYENWPSICLEFVTGGFAGLMGVHSAEDDGYKDITFSDEDLWMITTVLANAYT